VTCAAWIRAQWAVMEMLCQLITDSTGAGGSIPSKDE